MEDREVVDMRQRLWSLPLSSVIGIADRALSAVKESNQRIATLQELVREMQQKLLAADKENLSLRNAVERMEIEQRRARL